MTESAKIICRPDTWKPDCRPEWRHVNWKLCLPFVVNPRGILIHRVKRARTHWSGSKEPDHHSFDYWCGNGCSHRGELFAVPPEDKLLCVRCEAVAVAAGEKPADELAGRHVHIGELRAKRLCCTNEGN